MNWKVPFFLFGAVLSVSVGSFLFLTYTANQIHLSLGTYGVEIQHVLGHDVYGISGSWWNGYGLFESNVMSWLVLTLLFGVGMGCLATWGFLRVVRENQQ
jgi:hypothetical protein